MGRLVNSVLKFRVANLIYSFIFHCQFNYLLNLPEIRVFSVNAVCVTGEMMLSATDNERPSQVQMLVCV